MSGSPTRPLALVALLLGLAVPGSTMPGSAWASDKDSQPATVEKAIVRVEIKLESGSVLESKGNMFDWNEADKVLIDSDGTSHAVVLTVRKVDSEGKRLTVEMAYSRNSTLVIAPFSFETKPKKRELIQSDGGLALAITVTPKKVQNGAKKRGRDDSVEGPKNPDDPLDGLE